MRPLPPQISGNGRVRKFYQEHSDHIDIVETDISQAYKFKYASLALPLLQEWATARQAVLHSAAEFLERNPIKIRTPEKKLSGDEFGAFLTTLEKAVTAQKISFEQTRRHMESSTEFRSMPAFLRPQALEHAEITNLARHARKLFKKLRMHERVYFQAMYACDAMQNAVASDPTFKIFRMDKGEREIDWYLYEARRKQLRQQGKLYDPDTATIIVSEDEGARESVKKLREKCHNTVIVVGNDGLLTAVHYLETGSIPTIDRHHLGTVIARQQAADTPKFRRNLTLAAARPDIPLSLRMHPSLPTEGEWARRLAELVAYGQWSRHNDGTSAATRILLALHQHPAITAGRSVGG